MRVGGFPKIGVAFLGVSRIRIVLFLGTYLGYPYFGKYPVLPEPAQQAGRA